MKFVIDRAKWRCGENGDKQVGKGSTLLLNTEGYMCCLGFCSLQLGCTKDAIQGKSTPNDVNVDALNEVLVSGHNNSALAWDAMDINDDDRMPRDVREQKLSLLFTQYGHEIEFIGEYDAA